jgi:2-polyprenyl-6-methoxyphenol hydroxylase-like FAD-dependent oxidoreductase
MPEGTSVVMGGPANLTKGNHAIVIGASIAGLCAARVLADFFDHVTVYDRDRLRPIARRCRRIGMSTS